MWKVSFKYLIAGEATSEWGPSGARLYNQLSDREEQNKNTLFYNFLNKQTTVSSIFPVSLGKCSTGIACVDFTPTGARLQNTPHAALQTHTPNSPPTLSGAREMRRR